MANVLRWLSLDVADECAEWRLLWQNSLNRRPHDHPAFLELMKPTNYRSAVAVYKKNERLIYYPFFWCNLNELSQFKNLDIPLCHMISPYGYGGAIFEGPAWEAESAMLEYELLFTKELAARGFVTEFVREDIFSDRLVKREYGELIVQQLNVVVRLQRDLQDVWRTYKPKVRKNVKKAMEYGLRVELDPSGYLLDDFLKIYYDTMNRTNASNFFYIPKDKFQGITDGLGKDNGCLYVHVYDANEIISTELLLLSPDTIYSFLGGTTTDSFDKRPNDLLKHKVIEWGGKNGYKWYVLGGGVTAGDGIFKYKEAFDPKSILPFHVRRIIHNKQAYDLLLEARRSFENNKGINWQPNPEFFPGYLS